MKEAGKAIRTGGNPVSPYFLALLVYVFLLSCARESSVLEKAENFYREGKYRDAVFVIKHHLRRGGGKTADLLFLEGMSYLRLGMETQAMESFGECRSLDSTWGGKVAETLRDEAVREFRRGNSLKARRMVERAVAFDPGVDFGEYNDVAGEIFLEKNSDSLAVVYFERYVRDHPDTSGISKVMMNLATAYAAVGDTSGAVGVCREIIARYPKSTVVSNARWMLENMLYAGAKAAFDSGEYDTAGSMLREIIDETLNPVMKEKAYFLLGMVYEKMADDVSAVRCYREVVNLNLGSSSRLLEKAKERIEKLEAPRN